MIAIAGGTGRLGRRLAAGLLGRGSPVRVLTRDPGHLPAELQGRVEPWRIDLRDPVSLRAALDGVDTVVSAITGFGGPGAAGARAVDGAGNLALIDAAVAAGVGRFVLLSVARAAADAPVALFRAKHDAEQHLRASTLAWTIVRPTAYMETWVELIGRPLVETGRTRVFGRGTNPVNFVSAIDVAAIVEAIVVSGAYVGETFVVAGPENRSMDELVAAIERISGVSGRVDHASPRVMQLLATVMAVLRPVLADQMRAGLMMDTDDLRIEPTERLARFPSIPLTTLDQVIRRELIAPTTEALPSPVG